MLSYARPVSFALGLLLLFSHTIIEQSHHSQIIFRDRNFFGIVKVSDNKTKQIRYLFHGRTIHGGEYYANQTHQYHSYYDLLTDIFASVNHIPKKIAVIGLGTGTTACLGPPPDHAMTFYEIDPNVIKIAQNPSYFSYLQKCPPTGGVILGDGRMQIEKAANHSFDVIIVDAFSSDAIPTHLLNLQAVEIYLDKLSANGKIAFHITNKYVDLKPVLGRIAKQLNLHMVEKFQDIHKGYDANAQWLVLSKVKQNVLVDKYQWQPFEKLPSGPLWTDDYSNIVSVLK